MNSETRTFICPSCREPASSEVFGKAISAPTEDNPFAEEYALLLCPHCAEPAVHWREDFLELGFDQDKPLFKFPASRELSADVPEGIRNDFYEARRCLDARAPRAAIIMSRRVVEQACREQLNLLDTDRKMLGELLKDLKKAEKLDATLLEWAKLLQIVGNEGAHSPEEVSRDVARDAVDFAEAFLDNVYVLRARFAEFKKRASGATN